MTTKRLVVGLDVNGVGDITTVIQQSQEQFFSFITIPLFHPRQRRDSQGFCSKRTIIPTRSDLIMSNDEWGSKVVGKISPWIDLESISDKIRRNSEEAFYQEFQWASHLSMRGVIVPEPSQNPANYSRCLQQVARSTPSIQTFVRIPVGNLVSEGDDNEPWLKWNTVRSLCTSCSNIFVCLEITADLPDDDILQRWLGEPIKCVIIPTNIFQTNKAGFPALTRRHQAFLIKLMKFKVHFIMYGRAHHANRYVPYLQYLDHLRTKQNFSAMTEDEEPYLDYLQSPLQPLMDNLESLTYEIFEKDPVKYREYQNAVRKALLKTPEEKVTVLMVVGAGRGPLVKASISAAIEANRQVKIYAVEKNPNAVITIRNRAISEGWTNVTIIDMDMRFWNAPEKADILVSELLGSFGDNELSPECLDGAQRFLKEDGISIPSSYTSFLSPISSQKLWNEVNKFGSEKSFQIPYVVKIHNSWEVCSPQECFKFHHPNPLPFERIDNSRYIRLRFPVQTDAMVHGFAGYFETVLHDDVMLSILPSTASEGMFSWFPIYFPLLTPFFAPAKSVIEIHIWRCVGKQRVWYEWCVTSPVTCEIHNPNGSSYWIGL